MKQIHTKFKIVFIAMGCLAIILCLTLYVGGTFFKKSRIRFQSDSTTWKYARYIKPNTLYLIKKVIDGDTMIASVAGHDTTLRLIGIDTPETLDPRKPVGCFGHEASDKGRAMLEGNLVYLERDPAKGDYDKYGRALVYLHVPTNAEGAPLGDRSSSTTEIFYNQFMIENGFAREYTFSREPYKYQTEFKAAEEKARQTGTGLWNPATCNGK